MGGFLSSSIIAAGFTNRRDCTQYIKRVRQNLTVADDPASLFFPRLQNGRLSRYLRCGDITPVGKETSGTIELMLVVRSEHFLTAGEGVIKIAQAVSPIPR
jgi:hypothetical protein